MKLSASLLSTDITKFVETSIQSEKADYIHFDVMDGVFVPEITYGSSFIKQTRTHIPEKMKFDVHLMVADPTYIIDKVVDYADIVTIHIESKGNTRENLLKIIKAGKIAGLALNPMTEAEKIYPYLDLLGGGKGVVLLMTVQPGKGGQPLNRDVLPKFSEISSECDKQKLDSPIFATDGGVNFENAPELKSCGCNIFVVGSAVWKDDVTPETLEKIELFKKIIS